MQRVSAGLRACPSASASVCTPAKSWSAQSAVISTWTTRPWARPPTWRRAWSRWPTPGTILITPETLSLAEGFIQVTSLGPLAVKGLSAPVEIYEVVGAEAGRSRLQAAAGRGLTRFVGRDPEMDQLRLALERARSGQGQVVA